MTFTDEDRRYERYVRAIAAPVGREAETWRWRDWAVHVEHVGEPDAPVRLLLVHGAGGNAAAMWPFAAHLSLLGTRVTVLDLPGYGRTRGTRPGEVTYQDWQDVLVDAAERVDDGRPLVLVGASMGGMLALDTAARSGRGSLVVVTCLLDATDPAVRAAVVRTPWLSRVSGRALALVPRGALRVPLPLRWVAPMSRIANVRGLSAEVLRDRRGGGGTMPLGWFRTFLESGPAVRPEDYDGPPVLLVHPGSDRWTPPQLSTAHLARLAGGGRSVTLEGCGHFPVEEPGFQQLLDTVGAEVRRLSAGRTA